MKALKRERYPYTTPISHSCVENRCAKYPMRNHMGITKTSGRHFQGLLKHNEFVRLSNDIVFVEQSTYPRHLIKRRIIKDNLIPCICAICNQEPIWHSHPLVLQLDHINGVNNDNRLSNLRFLCPNCHSQQKTYAGKNKLNPIRQSKRDYNHGSVG